MKMLRCFSKLSKGASLGALCVAGLLQLLFLHLLLERHTTVPLNPLLFLSSTVSKTETHGVVGGGHKVAGAFFTDDFEGGMAIPLRTKAGSSEPLWSCDGGAKSSGRIACLVLSLYPRNAVLMEAIGDTWGRHCDALFWVLDDTDIGSESQPQNASSTLRHLQRFANGFVLRLNLTRKPDAVKRNTWEKVHRMYSLMYAMRNAPATAVGADVVDWRFDWYLRSDDDVFANMRPLRSYLALFRERTATVSGNDYPLWLGHTLMDRWTENNIVYNAGNLHVLNAAALQLLAPILMTLPTAHSNEGYAHCMDFLGGNDDPHLGACLNAAGVYPTNTLDFHMRARFLVFTLADHRSIDSLYQKFGVNASQMRDWFHDEKPRHLPALENCCVPESYIFNSHPVIAVDKHKQWKRTFQQYSEIQKQQPIDDEWLCRSDPQTGARIVRPLLFIHNVRKPVGTSLNSGEIPSGQRISHSVFGMTQNASDGCNSAPGNGLFLQCFDGGHASVCQSGSIYYNVAWDKLGAVKGFADKTLHQLISPRNAYALWRVSERMPHKLLSMNQVPANSQLWHALEVALKTEV